MMIPVGDDPSLAWLAAQVWTGREQYCARRLQERGYEVFLPCHSVSRRWSDRVKRVEQPLFAGYVFCRVPADVVGKIVTTPSVIRIVNDGERPLPIPADEIDAIRRVVTERLTAEPWQFLHIGQRVRMCAGPLCGVDGIVVKVKNRHRLILSVSLLKRSVAVEIDPAWVIVEAPWPVDHARIPLADDKGGPHHERSRAASL